MSTVAWPIIGHDAAEAAAGDALGDGRMHHAWLLQGPSGLGKARFAKRFAARLLGAQRLNSAGLLDSSQNDPVIEKMEAGSHPDLRWLRREPGDKGKLPLFISVERVREDVVNFITLKPALGGRRVCVIDSVDELNANGANALLKSLEEPPPNCVLLLIHHGQSSLLPTIRSRCRLLRFGALSDEQVGAVLASEGRSADATALKLSAGRPGLALALSEPDAMTAMAAAKDLTALLSDRGRGNIAVIQRDASASDAAFNAFTQALLAWMSTQAESSNLHAAAWLWVSRSLDHARRDAMDRGQTTAKLITGLQQRLSAA